MKPLTVLVACEESQAVTKQLRALGHIAYSCDIEPCSGGHPEWHIQCDVEPLLESTYRTISQGKRVYMPRVIQTQNGGSAIINGRWDMIIAFPPCTYLSNAGACRLYKTKGCPDPDRLAKGFEAKAFFMKILNADCDMIGIENPVSMKIFDMPKHTQEIQPWQFGHPYTKKTRLWLKGLPALQPTDVVEPVGPYVPAGTSRKDRSKYGAAKRGEDAKNRAKTFEGIAKAMAEQWAGDVR